MANQQAAVTVTGFVAGDPTLGGTESFRVLTFRMGSTRSRLNPTTRQWEDYGTAWVGVKAFRALAVNAASSVRRGDRIIVVGSLITEQWTNEQGEPRSRTVLEATNIGHDLTFGTTSLIKPQRAGNGNGGNGGNGNGNANGAVEGMDGGNGQRASSPYVRPTQYARAVPHPVWVLTRMRPRRNLAPSNLGSPPIPANRRRHQPSPRPWPMPSCRNRTPTPINHSPWPNKPTSTVSPNLPIPVIPNSECQPYIMKNRCVRL